VPLVAEYKPSKNWKNWLNDKERGHPQFALSQKKRRLIEKVFRTHLINTSSAG
jgi:hypothetical protein